MKTKLFTGLALAAVMLMSQPAFAETTHKAVSRVHTRTVAHTAVAAVHRSAGARVAVVHTRVSPATALATRRMAAAPATRNIAANRGTTRNLTARNNGARPSVAFGGNAANYAGNNKGFHGQYAFASRTGWSHDQEYFWGGHHYQWYDNGWFIIDPYPYGVGYNGPGYYSSGAPVSVQVQAVLQQQGYYNGPIDGIVGPGTEAAIAAYQQANGLRVTGTITHGLLNDLGIG